MSKNANQKDIEALLRQVEIIVDQSKEIAKLKGENFNIFSILGMESKENKTHSNFLASLLNPEGVHGLGDIFLKLFIETLEKVTNSIINENDIDEIEFYKNLSKVNVLTEKGLGKIDWDKVEGGRIDILIENEAISWAILIENKIYANDQYQQIARYCNYNKYRHKTVFYLTLFGEDPNLKSLETDFGLKEVNKDFFLLSYKENIRDWLEQCLKEVADYPIIRETIKQYLILIKRLTGQLTYNKMEAQLYSSIMNNLEAADVVSKNIDDARQSARIEIIKILEDAIKGRIEFQVEYEDVDKYLHLIIRQKDWHKDLKYLFEVNPNNGFSFLCIALEDKPSRSELFFKEVRKILGTDYNNEWACLSKTEEMCTMDDKFLSNIYAKSQAEKESELKPIAEKIVEYLYKFSDKVNEINSILINPEDS